MRFARVTCGVVAIAVVAALLGPVSIATAGASRDKADAGSYVGTVDGIDAYIALVVGERYVTAYVCDGDQIAQWLRGTVSEDGLLLLTGTGSASDGLSGQLRGNKVKGSVVFADGSIHDFGAKKAKGDAGLYRAEETVDGASYVGGWVVRAEGDFKGQVTLGGGIDPVAIRVEAAKVAPPVDAPTDTTLPSAPPSVPEDPAGPGAVADEGGADLFPLVPPGDAKVPATGPDNLSLEELQELAEAIAAEEAAAKEELCAALLVQFISLQNQLAALPRSGLAPKPKRALEKQLREEMNNIIAQAIAIPCSPPTG